MTTTDTPITRADLSVLAAELRLAIKEAEVTTLRWLVGLILPVYALIIGLLIFLVSRLP